MNPLMSVHKVAQDLRQIWRYGLGTLAVVSGFLLLFFAGYSFPDFEDLFQVFRQESRFTGNQHFFGFSFVTYQVTIVLLIFISAGSSLLFYLLRPYPKKFGPNVTALIKTVGFPFKKLRNQWKVLPTGEKGTMIFTGFLLVCTRIYWLRFHSVITDEAATYLLFVSKGLHASLAYYPIPNNHILYSILCLPFDPFFEKANWVLKLPSFLISLALFPVLYLGLRSVFRFPVALIVTVGCSFSNYALYYAVHGRGYTLLLFCTIILSISILKLAQKRGPVYWLLFMLSGIAGFLTVPVFLYPFASAVIFGAAYFTSTKNFQSLRNLIIACVFISIITLLLYMPAGLVSGAQQLYGNNYVQATDRQKFFANLPFYISYINGAMIGQESLGKYIWFGGLGLLSFVLIFRKRLSRLYASTGLNPTVIAWILCGTVLPFFMLMLHGVMPPERIWLFLVFADFLLLAVSIQLISCVLLNNHKKVINGILLICLPVYIGYQFLKQYKDAETALPEGKIAENTLRNLHRYGYQTIFSNGNTYGLNVVYEFVYSGEGSYVLDEFTPKPGRNYQVLILENDHPVPASLDPDRYFLHFKDSRVKIYFLRKRFY